MQMGSEIGKLARLRYPNGVLVSSYGDPAAQTQAALERGATCLFEATFEANECLARIDALTKTSAGWILDEVKSNSLREADDLKDKIAELAFERWVVESSGLPVVQTRFILVDTAYVWPGGEYDHEYILGAVDVTEQAAQMLPEVSRQAAELAPTLRAATQPEVETNTHCKKCEYFEHCHSDRPRHDVIHFSNIRAGGVRKLREQGYEAISDVPEGYRLTDKQRRMWQVIVSGKPFISDRLGEALGAVQFPAAFIDYETYSAALPLFPGTRAHQAVCFQWSAHIMNSPTDEANHREFLACDGADPREEFCRTLLETIDEARSIVHYSNFEISKVKRMAADGVPQAAELLALIESRSVDLLPIVQEHVYFEGFMGGSSIKVVLPVLVPGLSYKGMLIAEGNDAGAAYREMLDPTTEATRREELRSALLDYCRLDTLAMVEIYRALLRLSKQDRVDVQAAD